MRDGKGGGRGARRNGLEGRRGAVARRRNRERETASEKVSNDIPDDFAVFILSKLPLKSLKRFTCVRKSWTTLFENPYFMTKFRNNLISKHNSSIDDDMDLLLKSKVPSPVFPYHFAVYLLSGERFENKVKLNLPPPFQENDTPINYILGNGMNGTLCLYDFNHTTVVLWNPATEEFKVLPPIPVKSPPYSFTSTLHGFGYDHVRDDYNVIRHVEYHTSLGVESLWQIYSLKSNSWRRLDVDMPVRYMHIAGADVHLNGVCHWLGRTNDEIYVVSFNLSNEVIITTPIPSDMHDSGVPYEWVEKHFLMVLSGSVAIISKHPKTASFHISILGELGVQESWTKLFVVGPVPCVVHPIGAGKKGDIFFRKQSGELVHFDLSTQTIEEYGVKGEFFFSQIAIYKKNLLPIGGINN